MIRMISPRSAWTTTTSSWEADCPIVMERASSAEWVWIRDGGCQGIAEDGRRLVERHAVLSEVRFSLPGIPLETHATMLSRRLLARPPFHRWCVPGAPPRGGMRGCAPASRASGRPRASRKVPSAPWPETAEAARLPSGSSSSSSRRSRPLRRRCLSIRRTTRSRTSPSSLVRRWERARANPAQPPARRRRPAPSPPPGA